MAQNQQEIEDSEILDMFQVENTKERAFGYKVKKYQERLPSFAPELVKDKDMFTFRNFTYFFAAVLVFYTILSTFFGTFFRNKTLE